jgi:hypothetical protein
MNNPVTTTQNATPQIHNFRTGTHASRLQISELLSTSVFTIQHLERWVALRISIGSQNCRGFET